MTIIITAFERSPDGGKGLARDTRVRWALEEAGQPYQVRLVSFAAMKEPAHLALHPFGQIPTYEEGDLALFETGSIVFHIAERHAGLLPEDDYARARAITWMFAALNTVEPPILELATAKLLEGDKPWSKQRMPLVEGRVRGRLDSTAGDPTPPGIRFRTQCLFWSCIRAAGAGGRLRCRRLLHCERLPSWKQSPFHKPRGMLPGNRTQPGLGRDSFSDEQS